MSQRSAPHQPAGRILLCFSILLFSCQNEVFEQNALQLPDKPNILWLVAEDLSPIIPPFGDHTVDTPTLDRLAREGVRYTNLYSVSGVCAPSRFTLATGVYPTSAGAHNMRTQWYKEFLEQLGLQTYEVIPPPEVKMMSQVLRENGYYCTNNDKTDYQFVAPATAWDESGPRAHWRNRPEGKPFFSIFNFGITHESQVFWTPSKKNFLYQEGFPPAPETPIPGWTDRIDSTEWTLNIPDDTKVPIPPYLADTEGTQKDVRRVYSNIIEMDRQVNYILKQLEEDGLLENTIIVWYTDHGGPLPRQKRLLYDSGIHVPMIIRYPNQQRAGETDDQLISFVDFAPTAFSFAGIKPPAYLEGQAFAGKYAAASPRKYIHAAADRLDTEYDMIRAVRDKRFKYLRNFKPDQPYYLKVAYRENMTAMQDLLRLNAARELNEYQAQWFRASKPPEELFDCQNDPYELKNLADDPEYAEILSELRAECDRWMKSTDDKGFVPEGELLESFWPNREQPITAAPAFETDEQISLTCETEGASIAYQITKTNAELEKRWQVYTGPVSMNADEQLHAFAHRIGFKPSDIIEIKP